MQLRGAALACALAACAILSPTAAAASPEDSLKKGRLHYAHGSYKDAIAAIQPLIYPSITLAGERDLVEAYKVLALSYFFEGKREEAQREFENLLEIEPTFALDPIIEPPPAVQFLDEVKRGIEVRLKEIREREERERLLKLARERERLERERKLRLAMREKVIITRSEIRNPWARNLIPFGVPQFAQRRRGVGTFLLIGEGVTGTASAAVWTYLIVKYGGKPVPKLEVASVERLQVVHVGLGAAFFGLAIYGAVDAWRHHRSVEIVETRKVVKPKLPVDFDKPTTSLTPLFDLESGLAGLGIGGTF